MGKISKGGKNFEKFKNWPKLMMSVVYVYSEQGLKKIEKSNFEGCAQEMAHSKAFNKRFQKSAHMLKTNFFKSSYEAFLGTFLADSEDLKTLSAYISPQYRLI